MSGVLSVEPGKWAEVVESSGEDCLTSQVSANNVAHVLSTATVRGPQKTLCTAVLPFIAKMSEKSAGISILTSLVKFGTPKTVESIAKELLNADMPLWTLKKASPSSTSAALAELLDAFVYREDAKEEHSKKILDSFMSADIEKILADRLTLPAAGRLFCLHNDFAARVMKSEKGKAALKAATLTGKNKDAAVKFCERVLEGKDADFQATASKYIFSVFFVPNPDEKSRPREKIVVALTTKAIPEVVAQVGNVLVKWSCLRELFERDSYATAFTAIILRCENDNLAKKLASLLIDSTTQIDEMLASRKKTHLRFLTAIEEKPVVSVALEKKLSISLSDRLRASKVRYTNATVSRAAATQQTIMEKLKRLREEEAEGPRKKK